MLNERTNDSLDRAVLAIGVAVIVVLSLMTVARPARWTMLQLVAPVPTLTKGQRLDGLVDELYAAVDENDRGEVWRILDEIDKLLGRQWPPLVRVEVCESCVEFDCGKDIGVCGGCRKHPGKYAHSGEGAG